MADEIENHTVRLLQEMRAESRALRLDMEARFDSMNERLTDLVQRIVGNTLVFNLVAGVVHDHEARVDRLEQDRR